MVDTCDSMQKLLFSISVPEKETTGSERGRKLRGRERESEQGGGREGERAGGREGRR